VNELLLVNAYVLIAMIINNDSVVEDVAHFS